MRVIVITGAPGAGKTSVLTALAGLLEADDVRFAAVEVEALSLVHPWPDDDAAFDHLEYVAHSFQQRGYPFLLVGATIEDHDYLRRLRDAIPSDDVTVVRLDAPPEVLRERITRREPPTWVGLPRLLDAAGTIAAAIEALRVDIVLDTESADARTLAATVRDALQTT